MKHGLVFVVAILAGCASKPVVEKTTINEAAGTKTETVCTQKRDVVRDGLTRLFVPWYLTDAHYVKTCEERTVPLNAQTGHP